MEDEKIIKLAKKTRKEKYCKQYCENYNSCSDLCPIIDMVDCLYCEEMIYDIAFVDGFNTTLKHLEEMIKKSKITNDSFAYSGIYNQVINDIINKIKRFDIEIEDEN